MSHIQAPLHETTRAAVRRALAMVAWAVSFLCILPSASGRARAEPADFRSERFVLHTDLPAEKAKAWLSELEKVLDFAAEYWKRPPRGLIECTIVADLPKWPTALHERARKAIEIGGGVTLAETLRSKAAVQVRAAVFASAKGTSAKHEVIHAYCRQAFAEVGPLWYAEGMAEIGQYFTGEQTGINCEEGLAQHLRRTAAPSLEDVLAMKERTAEGYAWTWTLCHLLTNHPRYRDRFRQFGLNVLTGKKVLLDSVFTKNTPLTKEIEMIDFERRQMLANLEVGYRVDLCGWDWDAEFGAMQSGTTRELTVQAARGWQATGIEVRSGDRMPFRAAGTWRIRKNGPPLTADGAKDGQGKLVGVLLARDEQKKGTLQLGEPFDLGRQGTWTARGDGRLFVRCRDAWHELADNEGQIVLTLPASSAANAVAKTGTPKTASSKLSPEEQAASKLRVAKLLMNSKPDVAKARLKELTEQLPGSAAAKEAAELLRQLGD